MRVLVTGCGGFIGSEIVRQLLSRGDQVIGIARRDYPRLAALGMTQRTGDLTDGSFIRSQIRDADAVIHVAAKAGVWGPWQAYYRINTWATEQILAAARESGIRRLVYTSSPSVTFAGQDQSGEDESAPYPRRWLAAYPKSKALAERSVLAAHRPGEFDTCALRPHLVWGEDDPHLLPRIVDRARRGRLAIIGSGRNRIDTVHVINAAAAHLDALDALAEHPDRSGGRAYFITQDEPVDCWEWIGTICDIAGAPRPTRRVGFRAAYAIGAACELVYGAARIGREPPMTRFVACQLAKDHYFDISAARQRLGYRIRHSLTEGLDRLREFWPRSGGR